MDHATVPEYAFSRLGLLGMGREKAFLVQSERCLLQDVWPCAETIKPWLQDLDHDPHDRDGQLPATPGIGSFPLTTLTLLWFAHSFIPLLTRSL
jgi:hypothetical protein